MSLSETFGIAAAVASAWSMYYYLAAIWRGECRPNRVTYWIWFALSLLILLSYRDSGGTTVYLQVMYVINPFVIAVVSIWRGEKHERLSRWVVLVNLACAALASVSIPLWWMLRQHYGAGASSALPVLGLNLLADAFGAIPTFEKAWNRPETEDKRAWLVCLLAATLNLGAVKDWGAADIAWNAWMWGAALLYVLFVYLRPPSAAASET